MRTVVKKFYSAIEANDVEVAKTAYSDAVKVIAKVGQKGVIHSNQASRRISRLTLRLNSLSA